jgi:ABC-type nitrate/sulfonate/bicarbonate transport system permease component
MAATTLEKRWPVKGRSVKVTCLRVLAITIVLAFWEATARSGLLYEGVVPTLRSIGGGFARLITVEMLGHAAVTLAEVALAVVVGGLAGIAAGILLGGRSLLAQAFAPVLYYLAPTPKIVFLPILFSLFGVYMGSKVAVGAMSAFFPIAMSVAAGRQDLNPVFRRVTRSFSASRWQEVTKVLLPALAVPIFSGLRLGIGLAIVGVLLAETKISNQGLGFLAIHYYSSFQIADLYALLLVIFAFGGGVNALLQAAESRVRLH